MGEYAIDLRSDTVSMPTSAMRQAMFEAAVGDDVYGEDPTVNELEAYAAQLLEKEAALYVPSGTMGNLLALMVHCHRRGTAAIVGDLSHINLYEQGGAAHIGGISLRTVKNTPDGTFCINEMRSKITSYDYHEPITALVAVENTHNVCGGRVIPMNWIDELVNTLKEGQAAGRHGHIKLHMDGARLFNAASALGVRPAIIVRNFDSVSFCLSKGLSAPVGSILVGSQAFISEARRLRKALGGGMRQAGILAAAGLVALKTIVPQLKNDNLRAKCIAEALYALESPILTVNPAITETNILLIHCTEKNLNSRELCERLSQVTQTELEAGVVHPITKQGIKLQVSVRDWEFIRLVVYNKINDEDVKLIIKKVKYVVREYEERFKVCTKNYEK